MLKAFTNNASTIWSCLYQLPQLRMIRSSLTLEAAKTLVHAFISSRLDYCNSLLYGVSNSLLAKLQTVQNAAALVITGTRKFDHVTPVLRDLHWLPVRQRISFKLAMMVYKYLHGLALSTCLMSALLSHPSSAGGRSVGRFAIGWRNFVMSGPATWNRLPVELQTSSLSIDTFAKKSQISFV